MADAQDRQDLQNTSEQHITPNDPMSEAGRKAAGLYAARMLKEEARVREGTDIEGVHDMRVATRRMRSVLRLCAPYYQKSALKKLRTKLGKVADALGEVRDLDVFRKKTQDYVAAITDEAERAEMTGFLEARKRDEEAARLSLLELLDSKWYARFQMQLKEFLETPFKAAVDLEKHNQHGIPVPFHVRDVVPLLIIEQFTTLRAYEPVIGTASLDTLHHLRIEGKRLRYTLEAFSDVLGSEVKTVIDALKGFQDHLGDLQDTRVAIARLHDYVAPSGSEGGQSDEAEHQNNDNEALRRYLGARKTEQEKLRVSLPDAWAAFIHPDVKRALALAVSVL